MSKFDQTECSASSVTASVAAGPTFDDLKQLLQPFLWNKTSASSIVSGSLTPAVSGKKSAKIPATNAPAPKTI